MSGNNDGETNPDARGRFSVVLSVVNMLASNGIDVYEACLAKEMFTELRIAMMRLNRSKSARERLNVDAERLFGIAFMVMMESHGAGSPHDVAETVVRAYLDKGMDADAVEEFSKTADFATFCEDHLPDHQPEQKVNRVKNTEESNLSTLQLINARSWKGMRKEIE